MTDSREILTRLVNTKLGRKAKPPASTEHAEQVALFVWAGCKRVAYPDLQWLYSIPNGGGRANVIVGKKMKAEGLKPGYPDVGLDVARGGWFGLRLELKRTKGGRLSEHQEAWHRRLWSQGYKVVTCLGWEAAAAELAAYLALPATRTVVAA